VAVLLFGGVASAQQVPRDPFSIGVTIVSHMGCPVFVGSVDVGSPAERSGIKGGDHILAVESTPISDIRTAAHLLQADRPGSVTVTLARGDQELSVVVERERRSEIYKRAGKHIISGVIVSPDTSRAEVDRMLSFDGHRFVGRVFMPTHYPRNSELFYGGFEMFMLRDPDQVMVAGIEDSPAARAGVHWGDVVVSVSVNGIPVTGKTVPELESLFLGQQSKLMNLQVDRLGSARTFEFRLERAADIARQNGKRFLDGKVVPLWASEKDLHCFQ
jgi:C-terminal processing protease CtpA/Prc